MHRLISKCLSVLKGTPRVGLANLRFYRSKTVGQINRRPSEESRGSTYLQRSKHISMLPREERSHQNIRLRDKTTLKAKGLFQNKRRRIRVSYKSSVGNGSKKPKPSIDIVSHDGYLFVVRRPLTKREIDIVEINERAVEAFKNGDRNLFVQIVSSTKALYVRDNAVRLAAEVNWIEEAKQLLIKQTSDTYKYPVWAAPLAVTFARLNNNCEIRGGPESRHLLKTAVLSAVEKDREAVFDLLAPVVGVDFQRFFQSRHI